MLEKERVYDFLAGLNPEYDQLRVQVISQKPFPTLAEAHSYIEQEKTRRNTMLYTAPIEKSALKVSVPPEQPGKSNFAPNKDNQHCNYCG